MLAEDFDTILHNLGMAWLEHPLFHHAPVLSVSAKLVLCLKQKRIRRGRILRLRRVA